MSGAIRAVGAVVVALLLSSCGVALPHARVIRANYNVSRGEYQPAIVDYLRAREREQYGPWLSYNLGNVYHFLGESEAAVDQWQLASTGDMPDLLYGAAFNAGVYHFEQGDLSEALSRFRFALRLQPLSLPAKRNLQLTLERIEAEREAADTAGTAGGAAGAGAGSADATAGSPTSPAATRMLDYIRRREEQRWRANAEVAPDGEVRDW